MPTREGLLDYLLQHRTIDANNCWLWTKRSLNGYGRCDWRGKQYNVSRLSMFAHDSSFDIEDKSVLVLHKNSCHNRLCFNPEHLYKGSHADNARDRSELVNASTTFERCGHPRTEENCSWEKSSFGKKAKCKICKRRKDNTRNIMREYKPVNISTFKEDFDAEAISEIIAKSKRVP